jgi:hypothetical protein
VHELVAAGFLTHAPNRDGGLDLEVTDPGFDWLAGHMLST